MQEHNRSIKAATGDPGASLAPDEFRALVETLPDLFYRYRFSPPGFDYISPASTRLLGYTPEEYYADPELGNKIIHPDDRAMLRELMQTPEKLLDPPPFRWIAKDGRIIWTEEHNSLIRDEAGQVVAVFGVARDITERKQSEEALRQRTEELQAIMEAVPAAVFITRDPDTRIITGNRAARSMVELPAGANISKTAPEEERPTGWQEMRDGKPIAPQDLPLQQAAHGHEVQDYEMDLVFRDGTVKSVVCQATTLRDEQGNPQGGVAVLADVTEHKRAAEALLVNRQRYQALIETTSDFIWEMDPQGRYTYCSPQMETLWGLVPAEMIGKTPIDVMPPDQRGPALEMFTELMKSPRPFSGLESAAIVSEGRLIFIETSGVPFFGPDGTLRGFRGISRDITERRRAEGALRESEERFRQLADASFEGLVIHANGLMLDVNSRVTDLLGYDPASLIGRPFWDFIDPKYHDAVRKQMGDKSRQPYEVELFHVDGRRVPIEVMGRPILWRGKEARVAALRDLTARKRAEERLRESEEQLRALTQNLVSAVALIDEHGEFSIVNPSFLRMFDLDEQSTILNVNSQDWSRWRVFSEDGSLLDVDEHPVRKATQTRAAVKNQLIALRTPTRGDLKWLLVSAEPILDEHGDIRRMICTYYDITERKQAEEALARTTRQLSEVLTSIQDDFYVLDREWKFVFANRQFTSKVGKEPEDFVGNSIWELFPKHLGTLLEENFRASMEKGEIRRFEIGGRYTEAWYSMTSFPSPEGITVLGSDITARKRAESQLRESQLRLSVALEEAEAAVRLRDQFISIASHELKTPLTSIKGYAELLALRGQEVELDANFQRMANAILGQAGRLEKLVTALLDISRIERGQLALELAPVNLRRLVQDVVDEATVMLRKHTLSFTSTEEMLILEGDKARLEQVFGNLIQNAIKYSPLGGPISVLLCVEDGKARVTVSDHGIGIPAEDLPQMFTRFHRAKNAEVFHISGLGVGLYVVREIIRLHGGEIQVASQEGQGTTFTIWLPLEAGSTVGITGRQ